MPVDLEAVLAGFGSYIDLDLALDEARGLFAEIGEEVFEVVFGALGFEHDGAVGFVSDPACDWKSFGAGAGPHSEADALDSALEDDALAGDHGVDCSG